MQQRTIAAMSTISFSVEEGLQRDVNRWAKRAKKSKSDLFRDMAAVYSFSERMDKLAGKMDKTLSDLGIGSEEELYQYLESDETYEDRVRQQRLSGRRKK